MALWKSTTVDIKRIQRGIKHVLFQSYNWKDEKMNINNYKTSKIILYSCYFSERIFCWGQFFSFRTITSNVKFRSIFPIWGLLFIHKDISKNRSLGKEAWNAAAGSLELGEGFWPMKQPSNYSRTDGGLLFSNVRMR